MEPTQQTYTPSFVPSTPFGAMAAEKKSLLDSIANIAQKAADVATVIKAPAGTKINSFGQAVTTQNTFPNFNLKSLFGNPLVVAGVAVAVVLLLKK
jgi:hypothetical protein